MIFDCFKSFFQAWNFDRLLLEVFRKNIFLSKISFFFSFLTGHLFEVKREKMAATPDQRQQALALQELQKIKQQFEQASSVLCFALLSFSSISTDLSRCKSLRFSFWFVGDEFVWRTRFRNCRWFNSTFWHRKKTANKWRACLRGRSVWSLYVMG